MKLGLKNYTKTVNKLLYSIKRGDKRKMDDLFDVTFNHFYGYAYVKTYDKSKAEDAVMEMYARVLKYIDSFDPKKDGTGWMFFTLKNIIYDMNSEETEKRSYEQPIFDDDKSEACEVAAVSDIDDMYDSLGLAHIMAELDDTDRRITYLYFFERMTLDEIGKIMQLSLSAVHYRKQQIIKNFKKSFCN